MPKKLSKKQITIGLACQLGYEYENPGWEHIDAMLETYTDQGEPIPCDADDLYDFTMKAAQFKKDGKTFDEAEKELAKI